MAFLTLSAIIAPLILAFLVYRHFQQRKHNPKGLSVPVGPTPRLIVGNLRDVPRQGYEWVAYKALSEKHREQPDPERGIESHLPFVTHAESDIIFLRVLGKPILIINSLLAATDLLGKRGAIYSDRPRLPMLKELYVTSCSTHKLSS